MTSETSPRSSSSSSSSSPLNVDYAFSWRWFAGGILLLGIVAGIAFGVYVYQVSRLPSYVLEVADSLLAEGKADEAENLLRSFSDAHPSDDRIWKKRTEVSERMLAERGALPGVLAQGLELYRKLKGKVSEGDSLPYLLKIMEFEWERRNIDAAMQEAREILEKGARHPEWTDLYPAWRTLLLGAFQMLQLRDYFVAAAGGIKIPETMDAFFAQVYEVKPSDIEVAVCYADFLRQGDSLAYSRNASERFRAMTPAERHAKADAIVNEMVLQNNDKPQAWLTRYRYRMVYELLDEQSRNLDTDIAKALSLDPNDVDALTLAGLAYLYQSHQSRDEALAADLKTNAEAQFRKIIEVQTDSEVGYVNLGDMAVRDGDNAKAMEWWSTGLTMMKPRVSTELALRLVFVYISEGRLDDAATEIDQLQRYYNERRPYVALADSVQFTRTLDLLRAHVLASQGAKLMEASRAAQQATDRDTMVKSFDEAQSKFREAMVLCQTQLQNFGATSQDQLVLRQRAVARLVGESLMLLGRLKADDSRWDEATVYFRMATGFPAFRERALVAAARVYQQQDLLPEANQMFAAAIAASPEDPVLRLQYAQSLYRAEMAKPVPQRQFTALEAELAYLQQEPVCAQLRQPWLLDILAILVPFARDSSSTDPARVMAAQQTALQSFRNAETKVYTIPPDPLDVGAVATQVAANEDPILLGLVAAFYSSLAEVHDFERVLNKLRTLPEGESLYFHELIRDAIRRNDQDGVRAILEMAIASPELSPAQQQTFAAMAEQLMETGDSASPTSDALYAKMVAAYNKNPETFRPLPLFQMALIAIDRRDWKAVSTYQARIETLEGSSLGTLWRAVAILRALAETVPTPTESIDTARKLQRDLQELRPEWDLTHLLAARIEEAASPAEGSLAAAPRIIEHLKEAIRFGNRTPTVWQWLFSLLQRTNRLPEQEDYIRQAGMRGVQVNTAQGEFPEPYQRMSVEVAQAIGREDFVEAESLARACLARAEGVGEQIDLIYSLYLHFGKIFLDVNQIALAKPYLQATAGRGGVFVYPLAVCLAKEGENDAAFRVLLDEMEQHPSSISDIIPAALSLLSEATPSEATLAELDAMMDRMERGERDILAGTLEPSPAPQTIDLGRRRIAAFSIRFPGATALPAPETLVIEPPLTVSPFEEMPEPKRK